MSVRKLLIGAAVLGLGAACSAANRPCTSRCPPLEGTFAVTFEEGTTHGPCAEMGVTVAPGELTITQDAAALEGVFQPSGGPAVPLRGLAYDTWEFTLESEQGVTDAGVQDSASFRGAYGGTDGGTPTLTGSYARTVRDEPSLGSPQTCIISRPFVAD